VGVGRRFTKFLIGTLIQSCLRGRVAKVYNTYMIRVQYDLTEKKVAALRGLSQKTGISVAELIRRAVDAFLKTSK
jgi:hypothetical protein